MEQRGFFQSLAAKGEEETAEAPEKEPRQIPNPTVSDRGPNAPLSLEEKAAMLYAAVLSFLAGQVDFAQWSGPPPSNYDELYSILIENGTVIDDDALGVDVNDPRLEDLDFRIEQAQGHIPDTYRGLVQLMVDVFIDGDTEMSPEDNARMVEILMDEILPDSEEKFFLELLVSMKVRRLMHDQLMAEMGPIAAILGIGKPDK